MNQVSPFSTYLALIFLFSPFFGQGQVWNNTTFTYDKTDHPYGYQRHECGGGMLNINGEPVGVIIGGRGSDRKALHFRPRDNYADVGKHKAPYELHHIQAAVYNNTTLVAGMGFTGGYPNEIPSPNILAYDYTTDSFSTIGTVPISRRRGSATSIIDGDWLYFFSGLTDGHNGGWVSWVDRFNLVSGVWEELADAPRARDHAYALKEGGKVYLLGGRNSDADGSGLHAFMVDEVDVFDLASLSWQSSPMSLPTSRAGLLVASRHNGANQLEIAVWGGETSGGALKSGDLLNMDNLSIFPLPDLLAPIHATVIFQNGNDSLNIIAGAYHEGNENEISSLFYMQRFGTPDILPVEWLDVKAKNEHTGVSINWEVSEQSVNSYRIERKDIGALWQIVGSVHSQGDGVHAYQFTDATPNQGTIVNYRIVSTDYDGSLSYSRIMELGVDADLFAYPNPVKANGGSINFSVNAERLELTDAKGVVLASELNNSSLHLNKEIAPGLYFLRVFDEDQVIYARKILVE